MRKHDQGEDVDGARRAGLCTDDRCSPRVRRLDRRDRVGLRRARPVRRQRDEVIERLERATGGGMDASIGRARRGNVAPKRFARARRVPPPVRAAGEALGRRGAVAHQPVAGSRRLSHRERDRDPPGRQAAAAARSSSSSCGRSTLTARRRCELPPAIAVAFICIAFAFFLPNIWLRSKITDAAAAGRRGAARRDGPAGDLRRGRPVAGRRDGARRAGAGAGRADPGAGDEADAAGDPGRRAALGRVPPAVEPHGRRGSAHAVGDDHPDGDVRHQRLARACASTRRACAPSACSRPRRRRRWCRSR